MALVRIQDLAASAALTGAELLEIEQSGVSVKCTAQAIADLAADAGSGVPAVSTVPIVSGIARVDCDGGKAKHHALTLTGNATLALIGPAPTGYVTEGEILIAQDTTGSHALTLPAGWKPLGGSDTVVASAANAVTRLAFVSYDGGATVDYAMQERGA